MKKKKWWLIGLTVVLLLLVFSFLLKDKYLSPIVSPSPVPSTYVFFPDEPVFSSDAYVEMAKESLATKLKIDSSEITVVNITKKKWDNTSLGCPEKDKLYAEVITPGLILELAAKGKNFIYHAGLERVVSCKDS